MIKKIRLILEIIKESYVWMEEHSIVQKFWF